MRKLQSFSGAGLENVQVVSDFDFTITRTEAYGFPGKTSITIAQNTSACEKRFKVIKDLIDFYSPLELSHHLDKETKSQLMKEWWGKSSRILVEDKHDIESLENIVLNSNVFMRHGIDRVLEFCNERNIKFVIVSAGYGNVIEILMKTLGFHLNVEIHANFIDVDSEGKLTRIREPVIVSIDKDKVLRGRTSKSHVILMGDIPSVRDI